ncbi:MAG: ABC transporter ATP-binding protein [Mycoplasmatales bacterium]
MVFNVKDLDLDINNKKILSDVSVGFKEKQFNAIIGPNGCGKSSLIKIFAKIYNQSKGKVLFYDQVLKDVNRKDFAKQVAFFFQTNELLEGIDVKQMVSYGRCAHKKLYQQLNDKDFKVIEDAITKCDLLDLQDRNISTLSGGELQRVYLAMTLAQEPEVIVLDEPTNHLDIKYQYQLLNLIHDIMHDNNITIICILHDFNQVLKFADNTLILKDGKVFAHGKTTDILTVKNIKKVFGIDAIVHNDKNGYHIDFIVNTKHSNML